MQYSDFDNNEIKCTIHKDSHKFHKCRWTQKSISKVTSADCQEVSKTQKLPVLCLQSYWQLLFCVPNLPLQTDNISLWYHFTSLASTSFALCSLCAFLKCRGLRCALWSQTWATLCPSFSCSTARIYCYMGFFQALDKPIVAILIYP